MANRGTIHIAVATDRAVSSQIDDNIEDQLYYRILEHIRDAIDAVYEDGRKLSYLNIAKYLQPRHPGIKPQELMDTYQHEITAYTDNYE